MGVTQSLHGNVYKVVNYEGQGSVHRGHNLQIVNKPLKVLDFGALWDTRFSQSWIEIKTKTLEYDKFRHWGFCCTQFFIGKTDLPYTRGALVFYIVNHRTSIGCIYGSLHCNNFSLHSKVIGCELAVMKDSIEMGKVVFPRDHCYGTLVLNILFIFCTNQ